MKIVWTEPAVEDLRELHAYIARDSEVYASGFVERIISAAERVAEYPRQAALYLRITMQVFVRFFINTTELSIASKTIILKC